MSERLPWSKFRWEAWETDIPLALCSMAAQGFWMRLLCMCAKEDGFLMIGSRAPTIEELAFATRQSVGDVTAWLAELEAQKVFSRDRRKIIYSRRMVADTRKASTARANGKRGGNPSLRKDTGIGALDNLERERELEREEDNPPTPLQGDGRDLFRQALDAYPLAGQASTAPAKAADPWAQACAIETADRMIHAVKAFAASDYAAADKGKRVPSFQGWLRDRKYLPWLPKGTCAGTYTGPPDLRAAVVAAKGEPFAVGYIDRCAWRDVPERALVTSNEYIAKALRSELRSILRDFGVCVLVEPSRKDAA